MSRHYHLFHDRERIKKNIPIAQVTYELKQHRRKRKKQGLPLGEYRYGPKWGKSMKARISHGKISWSNV